MAGACEAISASMSMSASPDGVEWEAGVVEGWSSTGCWNAWDPHQEVVGACVAKEAQEVRAAGSGPVVQPMTLSISMEADWVLCDEGGKAIGICGCWTLECAIWAKTLERGAGAACVGVVTGIGECWTLEELAFARVATVG